MYVHVHVPFILVYVYIHCYSFGYVSHGFTQFETEYGEFPMLMYSYKYVMYISMFPRYNVVSTMLCQQKQTGQRISLIHSISVKAVGSLCTV